MAIRSGTVVVTLEDGVDHIVTKSATGETIAESWCVVEDGSYDEFAGLFTRLVAALAAHDVKTVAALMQYPLTVNGTRPTRIRGAAILESRFDQVFTPKIVAALRAAEVADVFCKNGTAMLADGTVWASKEKGRVGVFVVNQ